MTFDPLPAALNLTEEQTKVAAAILRHCSLSLPLTPYLVGASDKADVKLEIESAAELLLQRNGTITANQALMVRTVCEQALLGTFGPTVQALTGGPIPWLSEKELVVALRGIAAALGSRKPEVLATVLRFPKPKT